MSEPLPCDEDLAGLHGSDEAKQRLRWVLKVCANVCTVEEAAKALNMTTQEFEAMVDTAVSAMVEIIERDFNEHPEERRLP